MIAIVRHERVSKSVEAGGHGLIALVLRGFGKVNDTKQRRFRKLVINGVGRGILWLSRYKLAEPDLYGRTLDVGQNTVALGREGLANCLRNGRVGQRTRRLDFARLRTAVQTKKEDRDENSGGRGWHTPVPCVGTG